MTAHILRFPAEGMDRRNTGGTSSVLDAHLAELAWRNYRPSTITQRQRTIARLTRATGAPPEQATTEQIRSHLDRTQRDGQPLAASTRVAELAHLAGFFGWLVLEGRRVDDPTTRVHRPRTPRWVPRPIGEDDLGRAVAAASDRVRPILLLAAFAGLRACEIAPLKGEHVDLASGELWVEEGKGGHAGTVALAPALAAELGGMPRRGWLFPRLDGRAGHIPPHIVSKLANHHLHRLGISDTLHALRHRYGTQVYRVGGRDIRLTQEMMRHRSIVSTAVYTQVDMSEAAGVVGLLPALPAA